MCASGLGLMHSPAAMNSVKLLEKKMGISNDGRHAHAITKAIMHGEKKTNPFEKMDVFKYSQRKCNEFVSENNTK